MEQKVFTEADRTNHLLRAISGDGGDAVLVHQDAHLFVSHLDPGAAVTHPLGGGRGVYLYVIEGDVVVNDERMTTGDAAEIWDESRVALDAASSIATELILVDVRL